MRQPATLSAVLLAALLAAGAAQAQKVAPGLWENTVTMKSGSGEIEAAMAQMREQMAQMSPEQRKQLEAMMAGRGVGIGAGPGQATTVKVCVTPEQAAREDIAQPDRDCTTTSKERKGNTLRIKFACSGERKSSGEGQFTLESDKLHRGHMVLDSMVKGKPERMEMDMTGRWLSADCGAVKPRPGK